MVTVGELKLTVLTTTGLSIWEFNGESNAYNRFWRKLDSIGNMRVEIPQEDYRVLFYEFMALVAKGGGNAGQKKEKIKKN